MKSLYDISAPAKLNLFLHITGRRSDGYHLLQSVFMLIDWCDTLHFELRADGEISREDLGTPLPVDDLVVRAARALKEVNSSPLGVHIGIEKRIPAQAGMGGGSSDAASTLLALNRLWKLNYPLEKLAEIGLQLGADVPFFLGGRNAWVEGIGEKIVPVALPAGRFLVVKPAEGLDTGLIFSDPALKRDSETAIISGFAVDAFGFGRNDLQSVAQRLCPGVTQAIEWLASRGLNGRMTGSGSAVFAQVLRDIDLTGAPGAFQIRLCNSLDVHPLLGWATSDKLSVDGV
ncbi:MAG: 4-(cytidine 5'-diphospho)-2-C-methyl-D-erythritol kinase [Rhodoferax sp.]|uniref:4-(cytidine 5'-diphospho)-2-C-methyl-D-erythritol kinase n=1 Tax=Rhodoferax sp. TaxID=50421 RepID=UPI0027267A30|nr:4-(cytidine 5'-diphospho)-2-C-methyl-D-erythritol kinase [Rhodoferax sp.]MDO8448083.1 4-(cytidine 5'-diphospho)-2-C-methyl-D-erythritol kinase [Rhodoferax sp.]